MKILFAFLLLQFFCFGINVKAQSFVYSTPEKVGYKFNRYEVLGKNSQGVIALLSGSDENVIESFYDNMQLHWRKNIIVPDKNYNLKKIFLNGDTLWVFYTVQQKNVLLLKSILMNGNLAAMGTSKIIDTLSSGGFGFSPQINIYLNADKSGTVITKTKQQSDQQNQIQIIAVNRFLNVERKKILKCSDFSDSRLLDVKCGNDGSIFLLSGNYQIKNSFNDFPYTAFELSKIYTDWHRDTISFSSSSNPMSSALIGFDKRNNRILISSLIATTPGNDAKSILFWSIDNVDMHLLKNNVCEIPDSLISKVNGNTSSKKNDAFSDFGITEIIPRADGGMFVLSEMFSVATETSNTPSFNSFGVVSSPLTMTFYKYDNIAIFSFDSLGTIEHCQTILKKQHTENDDGYFSSYSLNIGVNKLTVLFNNFLQNQIEFTSYNLNSNCSYSQQVLFNTEKLGLLPVPKLAKQISISQIVMPSYHRNYLQFVMFTF